MSVLFSYTLIFFLWVKFEKNTYAYNLIIILCAPQGIEMADNLNFLRLFQKYYDNPQLPCPFFTKNNEEDLEEFRAYEQARKKHRSEAEDKAIAAAEARAKKAAARLEVRAREEQLDEVNEMLEDVRALEEEDRKKAEKKRKEAERKKRWVTHTKL